MRLRSGVTSLGCGSIESFVIISVGEQFGQCEIFINHFERKIEVLVLVSALFQ